MSLEGFVWAGLFLGVGATLVMDLWALFVKRAFAIPSLNYCFVGRWLCHMRNGRFRAREYRYGGKRPLECVVGWVSHYGIGVISPGFFYGLFRRTVAKPDLAPRVVIWCCNRYRTVLCHAAGFWPGCDGCQNAAADSNPLSQSDGSYLFRYRTLCGGRCLLLAGS